MVHCAHGTENTGEFHVSTEVIGVCVGLMSVSGRTSQKRASRSPSVIAVASWPVSERTRLKSSSRSIRVRSRALRSIAPEVDLENSSSDENEVSLPQKECHADFPAVSLQFLDPSQWKLAAYGGFFREENILVLEGRSILCAVRYAESNYPLPVLSDNLALVLALCKGRSNILTLLSVMRQQKHGDLGRKAG